MILAASNGRFSDLTGFRAAMTGKPDELVLQVLRNGRTGHLLMR